MALPSAPAGATAAGPRRGGATTPGGPVDDGHAGSGRAAGWFVGAATVASLVLRLLLARSVWSPFIFQDEGGYVAVARLLVGHAPSMYGPTYFPVYGILLAPAAAVLGPLDFHRAAQVLNAVAAAATIPAAYAVARQLVRLRPWLAAGTAVVGATTAASLLQTTMLLPESVLGLFVVLSVLAVHHALTTARRRVAALAGVVVGLTYGLHPRAVVLVVAVLVVAVMAWRAGVLIPRVAATLAAAPLATALAVQLVHRWATSRLYHVGTWASLAGSPLGSITEPGGAALITIGQIWYLLVASIGLVAVGFVAAGRMAHARRGTARGLSATFVVLGFLGSLALGAIASYKVGLGDVSRADQPVYGRYLEQWIPVLVVFAPLVLRRWSRVVVAVTAAATLALAATIHGTYAADVWDLPIAWSNIATLRAPFEWFGRDYLLATGALGALAVLVLVGPAAMLRRRRVLWVLPLAGMLALNVHAGTAAVDHWADPAAKAWYHRHRLGPVLAQADLPVAIGIDDDFEVFYGYDLQFWHPDLDVTFVDGPNPPSMPLRIGSASTPPAPGAVLVGTERDGDIGLWALEPTVVDRMLAELDRAGVPRPRRTG